MSADNWRVCPKCQKVEEEKHAAELAKAIDSYGKVSAIEYVSLVSEASNPPVLKETLREDWEIGIIKGRFFLRYSAYCSQCKFSFDVNEERDI